MSNFNLKIYGAHGCSKCQQLLEMFKKTNDVKYEYLIAGEDYEPEDLVSKTKIKSLPQVFDGEEFLGTYEDVLKLIILGIIK